jgi:dephospho-CoA kinase
MQVGVTGGIGAGKSTICKILQVLGIPVYDADSRAKQLMESSPELRRQIQHAFGTESYLDNSLNRSYLAEIVFSNEDEVTKLNELVHPKVGEDYSSWATKHEDSFPYIIKEAALLIESGSYKQLDHIVVVQAPKELRIKRVISRDTHRDEDQIRAIMARQLPDAERNAMADSVIYNDEKQSLLDQVFKLHQSLIQ